MDQILGEAGIASRTVPIAWNDFDFNGYTELAKYILDSYPDVDGLMAADLPTIAFIKAAKDLHRNIPDDFAVVAYDGTYVIDTCLVDVTRICQPYVEIASKAVEVLMKKIYDEQDDLENGEAILPVKFHQGITTA